MTQTNEDSAMTPCAPRRIAPWLKPRMAIIAMALSLSACVNLGSGKAPESLLTLTSAAKVNGGAVISGTPASAMTVLLPDVPRKLATNRVPVQMDDVQVAYLVGAAWVESPNRLFRALVSETLAANTGRLMLDQAQFATAPETRLSGELIEFGVDAPSMQAVIIYDATLSMPTKGGQGTAPVRKQRFIARVPVSEIKPAPVGDALNRAANQIAADISTWVGK
jgi:cholesterol transport system auxiliary component